LAAKIRAGLNQEKTILADRRRVDQLVDRGRDRYRQGDYAAAAELFDQALEIDANHDLALSYKELAQERIANPPPAAEPLPTLKRHSPSAQRTTAARKTVPPAVPTPGLARIFVRFDSPLNSGHISILLDGESLEEIPFDFSKKTVLGIKRKGTGSVHRTLIAPSGQHTIGVRLSSPDLATTFSRDFDANLRPGSQWTLRTDLPSPKAEANFFFIAAGR